MPVPELLHRLLTATGPSGHESAPARAWREGCAGFADEVAGDHVGSSYARVAGNSDGPRLAVIGHIDEIGLHVSHIDDDGYLRFGQVGGWDPIVLVGQRVRIEGRGGRVRGVIGRKPIHLLKDDDRKKVPELKELHIDIGVSGADEARELVRIGDVAVIGHIDEIGLHVSHIDDDGYLRFGQVGGWDPIVLVGQRVQIEGRGRRVRGVIGRKPIHLLKDDDRKKVPELKELHIDIGVSGADEARELVRIGDVAVIDAEPFELRGDRVVSRALDNRVGCYVAVEAARLVAEQGRAPGDVVALAVAQEETTFAGSRTSAFALEPDVAIVVDLTFATDQPGIELGPITRHPLGSGPVIARGTTLHPRVFELLYDTAEQEGIPFTLESLGRGTGTDADAIHLSRSGIPTGLVSVPSRYMHSPVEMVSVADVDGAASLIAAFAQRLEPGMSFER